MAVLAVGRDAVSIPPPVEGAVLLTSANGSPNVDRIPAACVERRPAWPPDGAAAPVSLMTA
jgi:hypothetical protein